MELRVAVRPACNCGQDHGPTPHVAEIIARAAREHAAPPAQPQPKHVPAPDTTRRLEEHFRSTLLRKEK